MSEGLPSKMHAWTKHKGSATPTWEQVPIPRPVGSQILVKMIASGGKARTK